MPASPSPLLEKLIAILLPITVREEVLGDLHERYQSAPQYLVEALRTIPLVAISRIRRTADAHLTLTLALLIYLCYIGAAWFAPAPAAGLPRLTLPAVATLLGILLADAYASQWHPIHAPIMGTALALLAETTLPAWAPELALPGWIVLAAASLGLVLSAAMRIVLGPGAPPLHAVGGRAAPLTASAPVSGYVVRTLAGLALIALWYQLRKEVLLP